MKTRKGILGWIVILIIILILLGFIAISLKFTPTGLSIDLSWLAGR